MIRNIKNILNELRPVIYLLGILFASFIFIIEYRFHQKSNNKELIEKKLWWYDSPIAINGFNTHHVSFFKDLNPILIGMNY